MTLLMFWKQMGSFLLCYSSYQCCTLLINLACAWNHTRPQVIIKMSIQYITLPVWNPCQYILLTVKSPILITLLVPTYSFAQDFHTQWFFVLFQLLLQVEHLKDLSPHPAWYYPQRQSNPSFFSQQFSAATFFFHYQISSESICWLSGRCFIGHAVVGST